MNFLGPYGFNHSWLALLSLLAEGSSSACNLQLQREHRGGILHTAVTVHRWMEGNDEQLVTGEARSASEKNMREQFSLNQSISYTQSWLLQLCQRQKVSEEFHKVRWCLERDRQNVSHKNGPLLCVLEMEQCCHCAVWLKVTDKTSLNTNRLLLSCKPNKII